MRWMNILWFALGNLQALILFWAVMKICRKYNLIPKV
jgi:hypothetical protein